MTSCPCLTSVGVALSDAIDTLLNVGAVVSIVKFAVVADDPAFPAVSV